MKIKHFILVCSLLILTTCSGPELDKNVIPFIGGDVGLYTYVLDGAPPPVVTGAGTYAFSVILGIENLGESDVGLNTENPFVLARLSGIQPKDFNVVDADLVLRLDQTLRGAKKNFDNTIFPGDITTLNFESLMFMPLIFGSEIFTFHAEICYDYTTNTMLKVCIKDNIVENFQDSSLCNLRSDLIPFNSGAPLQIVEAKQNPLGNNKIQVNFVIQNIGNGVFFSRADDSDYGACDFNIRGPTIYKTLVVVHSFDPDNYELDCRGLDNSQIGFEGVAIPAGAQYGVIRMRDNAPKSLTCFLNKIGGSGRVFQDLLNVDLYYRYAEFLEIPLLVQEASGYDII